MEKAFTVFSLSRAVLPLKAAGTPRGGACAGQQAAMS